MRDTDDRRCLIDTRSPCSQLAAGVQPSDDPIGPCPNRSMVVRVSRRLGFRSIQPNESIHDQDKST
jgi:hypothetical protein